MVGRRVVRCRGAGRGRCRRRRRVLRAVPGAPGRAARSDRRAEIRVEPWPLQRVSASSLRTLATQPTARRRSRSLGVTIGVAVVITMVAMGTGARMSIQQHIKAAGTNQIHGRGGQLHADRRRFRIRRHRERRSAETADDNLGGWRRLGRVERAASAAAATGRGWWPGRGISPRLPGRGAARTLTVEDAEAIAREVRRRELSRARRVGDRSHSYRRRHALWPPAGHRRRSHVDPSAHVRGRPVLHATTRRGPREGRRAVVDGAGTSSSARAPTRRPDDRRPAGTRYRRRRGPPRRQGSAGPDASDEVFIPYTDAAGRAAHHPSPQRAASRSRCAGESSRVSQDIVRVLRSTAQAGPGRSGRLHREASGPRRSDGQGGQPDAGARGHGQRRRAWTRSRSRRWRGRWSGRAAR